MLDKVSEWLVRIGAAGLVIMTGIIGWQVFGRFVLNSSPSWSEPAALILMIWYVLFAAAAGVREGFHIRIALLENMSSPSRARIVRLGIHLLVALFGAVLLVFGTELAWLVRGNVIPGLGISRGFAYLPLPFSGLLMMVFALAHARNEWRTAPAGGAE
ncbi:TRAP transporter small permease [Altererythrobacter sp. ZODW24]|uniref:TRAP transporter small permease n=1 Tax=Altererythrobacter sp. ZODW24 TaxID=2185142 RepID=UPI000DF72FE8|nr:TRAP transporter small permease [Altererythrobacter sp. ZODW24]